MSKEKLRMRQELGLLEAVVVIVGIVFGSGVFITPKEVLVYSGSVWACILVWTICGLLATVGALCYAELGTMLARSGGDYHYINEAYGPFLGFLFLWDSCLVVIPSTNAIMGLAFASTILHPMFPGCPIDPLAKKLVAAATICLLTFVNAYNVRVTTRLQNFFVLVLSSVLALIVITAIIWTARGNVNNFKDGWAGTNTSFSDWAVAFFAGVFSYIGWGYLNFMVEELKHPSRNLPLAIYISLPIVTVTYVVVNVSYIAVLGKDGVKRSESVALDYAKQALPSLQWVMPVLVATAILGGLSVNIMTSSRICFAGARNGHLPEIMAHINVNTRSPVVALLFLMIISLLLLMPESLTLLITYSSVVESFFTTLSCSVVIYYRFKAPHLHRPIKVNLCWPIIFTCTYGLLLFAPVISQPWAVLGGLAISLLGLPVYCVFIKLKPNCVRQFSAKLTRACQKLFLAAFEENE